MSIFARIGANLDIMSNSVFIDAMEQLGKHSTAAAQIEKQFGKSFNDLTPEEFSRLSGDMRQTVTQMRNNPLDVNKMDLGGVKQPTLFDAQTGQRNLDTIVKNMEQPKAGGGGGTGGTAAPEAAAVEAAAENKTMYNWMAKTMGLTDEGAKAADYSGGFWEGTKNTAKWFVTGSGLDKTKKLALGAGGYAGLNLMGRGLTGGGITTNGNGERDIAGIPFV